ncbi:organic cation/carnitine transporter 3-like [Arachis duranensis]|uniref:Organic cation/carnitine transporter 3-like n=1 Tax=Arachis duranensis TaxID=130453 RepID=A0A9C6TP32_ARADU|nr:organic cation/carnitine transporter 3-like [Arachis duranensis]
MVGSTPFLLSYSSSSLSFIQLQDDENDEQITSINSVVEECIGELNWKQLFQVVLSFRARFKKMPRPSRYLRLLLVQSRIHNSTSNGLHEQRIFMAESVVIVRGKKEEAIDALKSITSLSNVSYFDEAISAIMPQKVETFNNFGLYSSLKIMLQKKWSSRRLVVIIAMGLGIGLVYFGMPLGLELLSFNIYLSVTFNALSEIPSAFLAFMLIDKFNRRSVILTLTTLSGISSVVSTIEVVGVQIVFELVSFICACTAYDVLVIYGTELFPTCVRNSALSLVRQAGVLGGTLCPMLVAIGRGNKFLCYGVFGLAIGCSGLFLVCLPETKGKAFCDTIHEEESKQEVVESFVK